jgi:hypothetical protein
VQATTRVVHAVVRAFNRGDTAALNTLVAPAGRFQWFSAPGPDARLGPAAYRRSTLAAYVRKRHRHHEQLTLRRISTGPNANGNFDMRLVREADDYRRRLIEGKGAVDCTSSPLKLMVWSLGGRVRQR